MPHHRYTNWPEQGTPNQVKFFGEEEEEWMDNTMEGLSLGTSKKSQITVNLCTILGKPVDGEDGIYTWAGPMKMKLGDHQSPNTQH